MGKIIERSTPLLRVSGVPIATADKILGWSDQHLLGKACGIQEHLSADADDVEDFWRQIRFPHLGGSRIFWSFLIGVLQDRADWDEIHRLDLAALIAPGDLVDKWVRSPLPRSSARVRCFVHDRVAYLGGVCFTIATIRNDERSQVRVIELFTDLMCRLDQSKAAGRSEGVGARLDSGPYTEWAVAALFYDAIGLALMKERGVDTKNIFIAKGATHVDDDKPHGEVA